MSEKLQGGVVFTVTDVKPNEYLPNKGVWLAQMLGKGIGRTQIIALFRDKYGEKITYDRKYGQKKTPGLDFSSPFAMFQMFGEMFGGGHKKTPKKAAVGIVSWRRAGALHPEREADALTHGLHRLRHAMGIVELRRVVHHEQAARLEVDVNQLARPFLRAYGHAPRRTKRNEGNREAFANLV